MGKRFDTRADKVSSIPNGEPFVQLTRELIASDAWRSMSINCRRLIDFLMIEHMNHAAFENGYLKATYKQLEEFGINRVHEAIKEAEDKGLLLVEHGFRKSLNESSPNTYQLTFFKYKTITENNVALYCAPEHQWKRYTLN